MGASSERIANVVEGQKRAPRDHVAELVVAAGWPERLADQLAILANGAMASAAVLGSAEPARQAKDAARLLVDATPRR